MVGRLRWVEGTAITKKRVRTLPEAFLLDDRSDIVNDLPNMFLAGHQDRPQHLRYFEPCTYHIFSILNPIFVPILL